MENDRWNSHRLSRMADLKALYRFEEIDTENLITFLKDHYDSSQDFSNHATIDIWDILQDCRSDYGLSFEIVYAEERDAMYLRYLLSWGGPSEEIRFYLTRSNEIKEITFVMQDWFEHHEGLLDEDEQQTAIAIFDLCQNCGILEKDLDSFNKGQD